MPQQQTPLNNSSNDVTITVNNADNALTIYLNPDQSNVNGFVKVYETLNFGGPSINATISLQGFLDAFNASNSSANPKTVELVIVMSNFAGPGNFNYTISGSNISLGNQQVNLTSWTSQTDSYIISFY